MDGPSIRTPRIALDHPVEILVGGQAIRLDNAGGNVGAGGIFVSAQEVPLGTAVHIRVEGPSALLDADGVVRHSGRDGVKGAGIEFTSADRLSLDALIAELSLRGLPAA